MIFHQEHTFIFVLLNEGKDTPLVFPIGKAAICYSSLVVGLWPRPLMDEWIDLLLVARFYLDMVGKKTKENGINVFSISFSL